MKRVLAVFPFLGLFLLWPADFWQKKKFPDWTEKEARKLIADSPWARVVSVGIGGAPGGRAGGRRGRGGGGSMDTTIDASAGSGGMEAGGGRSAGGFDGVSPSPTADVVVRWHSALPVKQAVARLRFGAEAGSSEEARKLLGRNEPNYVVGFIGVPAQLVRGGPEQLKPLATLRLKDQDPVAAANITGERDRNLVNLYVFFARGEAASPLIKLEDGEVEVRLKLPTIEIRRKFRLKEMVYDGKLEI